MSLAIRLATSAYALLLRAYPSVFCAEFGEEMKTVFSEAVQEAARQGRTALVRLCLRELQDWLHAMPTQQWCGIRKRATEMVRDDKRLAIHNMKRRYSMSETKLESSWSISNQREAFMAALPPVLAGLGIALSAVAFGGGPWRETPTWRVTLSVIAGLIPAVAIAIGGCIAILRRVPNWGYTWLGAFLAGVFFLITVIADEAAESGGHIVSPTVDIAIGLAILLAVLVALVMAALRGWQQAGLVSIGLASIMGLALFSTVRNAPFYRYDLSLLAVPSGCLIAALIYVYVRRPDLTNRIAVLCSLALLNAALAWGASLAVHDWVVEHGEASFLLPALVLLTGVLLAGPILSLLSRPLRPLLGRA